MSDTILAVAPNPAIDKTAVIPGYRLGAIHRPEQLIALAGGKGLNVARSIARLGGEVRACAMLAGHAGRWVAEQLNQESIPASITWTEGETRGCLSVYDPETHLLTEVYEDGASIDPASWLRFEADVAEELEQTKLATFSGSLPPGAPTDGYARLLRLARDRGVPVVLDSRGEPLRHALPVQPPVIKINLGEASEIMMRNICSIDDAIVAAQELRTAGAVLVILTLGKEGAIAVTAEGVWHATPPAIEAIAPVGSGDAFLGGLALAMLRGELLPQALCIGVAAGAANTLTLSPGMIEAAQVWQLVDEVQLRRIPPSS